MITYTWIVDTEVPVITTEAKDSDLGCNPVVVAPVFTGTDNCEGTITPDVDTDGPSNIGCEYTQTWTATYTDQCNRVAVPVSITRTWTQDTERPVISTDAVSTDLGCNPQTIVKPVFTGLDNCEGAFDPVVTTDGVDQRWMSLYPDMAG